MRKRAWGDQGSQLLTLGAGEFSLCTFWGFTTGEQEDHGLWDAVLILWPPWETEEVLLLNYNSGCDRRYSL